MIDEYLDLVDTSAQIIGKKLRPEVYDENLSNFRVVNLFLINSKGEIWIPRRSADKRIKPLCLDMSMGGHVESGETYDEAMRREVKEELNLDATSLPVTVLGKCTPHEHGVTAFMQVYEMKHDKTPDYNKEDFIEYFWLTPLQIFERIKNGDQTKDDLPKLIKYFYGSVTL